MNHTPEEAFEKTRDALVQEVFRASEAAQTRAYTSAKTILSLSGGALVFSMTFVEKIAPAKQHLWLLFSSWVAFAISMLAVVVAMKRGETSASNRMRSAAKEVQNLDDLKADFLRNGKFAKVDPFYVTVKGASTCNWTAFVGFAVGIFVLGIFVALNLYSAK